MIKVTKIFGRSGYFRDSELKGIVSRKFFGIIRKLGSFYTFFISAVLKKKNY
jgi:hypothetical protein